MNKRDPKFWALIGFGVGAVAASGGAISSPLDSILSGLLQGLIWYLIASVIIKKRQKLNHNKTNANNEFEDERADELKASKTEINGSSQKRISLRAIFAIFYALGVAGALVSVWESAGAIKVINPDFTLLQQIENFIGNFFYISTFIDVFVYPSLFSALLITFSVKVYRYTQIKLKHQRYRFLAAVAIALIAIIIWILFTIILATILS